MSILVNKSTRVICQGITGKAGAFHTKGCKEYGTQMVGGVVPGKGGQTKEGFPLFNTVAEAVRKTGANATMIFVPPPAAADAIMEAADAGVSVIVAITEGIPVLEPAKPRRDEHAGVTSSQGDGRGNGPTYAPATRRHSVRRPPFPSRLEVKVSNAGDEQD